MKLNQISPLVAALGLSSLAVGVGAQQAEPAGPAAVPPAAAPTAAAASMALPQVVEQAIMTNPEVRARFQDFTSSLEGQEIARAGWRPQITAQGWVGKEWRSNVANTPSSDWSRPGWSLELRQMIFDGAAVSNNIKRMGFEKLSKFYDLRATTETLASDAVGAYLDVQRYREMSRLANENFTMHKTTMNQLRERQQSGVGRGVDLEQASGRVSLAQTNLMTENNNLNDVTQRYRRIVGSYPGAMLDPVPVVSDKLPVPGVTTDFSDALRINSTLLSKQALVQSAEANEKVANAAHSPTLELRAGTGRDREQPGDVFRNVQSSRVQLLLTYNLYRGGADEARVRQTIAQAYAARDVRDFTCRNVQQDLAVAWNNITRLRQQIPFMRDHELSTAKVRQAYQQQFQIGQRSLLDLLDTENELFDARRALLNAVYDLKKFEYQWLTMAGQVLPALGLVQPHADSKPEETQDLALADETLRACLAPLPDTSNLVPLVASYRPGAEPPVIKAAPKP